MSAFSHIIKAWIQDKDKNVYCPFFYLTMYSDMLVHKGLDTKFRFLVDILNNPFVPILARQEFLDAMCNVQKVYYGFLRFAHIFRYKKAIVKNTMDMYMNELREGDKNVISILSGSSKYLFLVSDIKKMIHSALLNASYFFMEPLRPKNPYDNIEFGNATLYNIYMHIRFGLNQSSILLDLFFKSGFDLDKFLFDNEDFIKSVSIKNYVTNYPSTVLYDYIYYMLDTNRMYTKRLCIHREIPKDVIVNIFRPYLHLYYCFRYGTIGTSKRNESLQILKSKLRDFVVFNPFFGRKKTTTEKILHKHVCGTTGKVTYQTKTTKKTRYNLHHVAFSNTVPIIEPPRADEPEENAMFEFDSLDDQTSSDDEE